MADLLRQLLEVTAGQSAEFGAELQRQARTHQTMQRQMARV